MTSQAPCRYVHNILITYDENKAKADIPIHMRHKYNTTAAYEKRIFFWGGGFSKSEKFKLYHTNT